MFSAYTGLAALLALVVFHCEALTVPPIDGNLATTPAPLIPLPLAAAQSPANPLHDIQIQCKGPSFGTGINYASCLDAFGTFRRGTNTRPITIGQRGQRVGLSVPSRWISDDGLCVFDIVRRGTGPPERSSGSEIARAAWRLMLQCVRDGGGQGGVVSGIGQSGTVGVILRKNNPVNVVCGEEPQNYGQDKCSQLLLSLPANVQPPRVFGAYWVRAAGQHVDELIPTSYPSSPPTQCRLGIWPMDDLSPMTIVDTATWYEVWQAGIALAGMCARKGLGGRVLNFGVNRRLQITLDDNSDPILKNIPAGVNVTVVRFPFGGRGVRNETVAVAR